MRNALNWWLVALSGAVMSFLLVLLTHAHYSKPLWSYTPIVADEPAKKPLWSSVVANYALPGAGPSEQDYAYYTGMLMCAIVVSGLAFNAWLISMRLMWRQTSGPQLPLWKKVLPFLLLLPFALHYIAMQRFWQRSITLNNAVVAKYHAEARAKRLKGGPPNEVVLPPDSSQTAP